jgi:hypothetical protein
MDAREARNGNGGVRVARTSQDAQRHRVPALIRRPHQTLEARQIVVGESAPSWSHTQWRLPCGPSRPGCARRWATGTVQLHALGQELEYYTPLTSSMGSRPSASASSIRSGTNTERYTSRGAPKDSSLSHHAQRKGPGASLRPVERLERARSHDDTLSVGRTSETCFSSIAWHHLPLSERSLALSQTIRRIPVRGPVTRAMLRPSGGSPHPHSAPCGRLP